MLNIELFLQRRVLVLARYFFGVLTIFLKNINNYNKKNLDKFQFVLFCYNMLIKD